MAIRDAYIVARSIYETAINACFILTNREELSERAWRYARQKALRDLQRTIELAGNQVLTVNWSGADAILADPASKALLEEFTSKTGREITSWTPENVAQRLEAIDQAFGRDHSLGLILGLLLYRHASEIAHGTLLGRFLHGARWNPRVRQRLLRICIPSELTSPVYF